MTYSVLGFQLSRQRLQKANQHLFSAPPDTAGQERPGWGHQPLHFATSLRPFPQGRDAVFWWPGAEWRGKVCGTELPAAA